ncbi:DNA polymerase IV [Amycolatopsis sp. BJA-103]|uniref:DNA polymerase IV n=1 Tax=Amycolatopsis sp. BJA-103 TaxID=1911175 RepID=UPI000C756BAD|nr:DNA polymerase IV [Amycolatopsis sp. BJA-103]AUI58494.1 DNA polymerase IV [Amycolatopsis sp. BJA-103]PNE15174.1 DNA polymerase IV [Amycolatopsis sp. BJA-103]
MAVREWVLHVDLDQFIAAVEVARRPELRGKPVVVGGTGDPAERAVVATASYEAREFGVQSGMPLRTAAKRCPDAVFLATDAPAYQEVSDRVMATLRELPVVVEVLGWDEAFLGVATDDPETLAADIRRVVTEETGLSCSVGIGDNKLRAKLATGFAKPAGIFRLVQENWWDVMAEKPTDALWGIGAKTTKKLAEAGYHTVLELAGADPAGLAARFGPKLGPWYRILAGGIGDAEVTATPYVARSRSRETTFQQNLTDPGAMAAEVVALAKRVSQDVAEEGRPAARVAVKVRFAPFLTHTHSVTLPAPTADPAEIEKAALAVLDLFDLGRPVRLLGVRAEFSSTAARSASP